MEENLLEAFSKWINREIDEISWERIQEESEYYDYCMAKAGDERYEGVKNEPTIKTRAMP